MSEVSVHILHDTKSVFSNYKCYNAFAEYVPYPEK